MNDEGYIKFACRWIEGPPPDDELVASLLTCRNRLHRLTLIGLYPDGVGYGNISIRDGDGGEFIISGTQTGGITDLRKEECTRVVSADLERNFVICRGPVKASSESMTHAAIYRSVPHAGGVIHIHHRAAWGALLDRLPTSRSDVPYGTPEMVYEIARLVRETDLQRKRVMVMGGHPEGIISFGRDLEEAERVLMQAIGKPI